MEQFLCYGLMCSIGFGGSNSNQNYYRKQNYGGYEIYDNSEQPSYTNNNYNNRQNYYQPSQQRIPDSPCSYFEYVTDNNGETQGRISFQSPQDSTIELDVELSVGARLNSQNSGSLDLESSDTPFFNDFRNGRPLVYRVKFPLQNPLPKLTAILYNNQKVCSGPPDRGNTVTTIKLSHSLFTGNYNNRQFYSAPLPFIRTTKAPQYFETTQSNQNPSRPSRPTISTTTPRPLRPTRPTITTTTPYSNLPIVEGSCGNPTVGINSLIINGSISRRGDWPWLVAFYYNLKETGILFICGGSLISSRHVITAAHCIQNKGEVEPRKESDSLFFIGKHNLDSFSEEGYMQSGASKFIVNPDWDASDTKYDADIGIVVLSKTVQFTENIKPICLLTEDTSIPVGSEGTVAGWGKTEDKSLSTSQPRVVNLPIVEQSECLISHMGLYAISSNRTFCAGKKDGKGPCNGDSGGGLVFKKGSKWFLKGIVSASLWDSANKTCDLHNYLLFTDAAKFIDWIRTTTVSN